MKNKKIYIRLMSTYLVTFLLPFFISIISLENFATYRQEEICRSVLTNLNHTKEMIDKNFKEIYSLIYNLTANNTIQYAATQMDEQDKYIKVSKLYDIQKYMNIIQLPMFSKEYYLYFEKSDMVISPQHIFLTQDSYRAFFQYDGMEPNKWEKEMEGIYSNRIFPSAGILQNEINYDGMLYVQPLVTVLGIKGNFVVPIRSDYIKELLNVPYVMSGGWMYITDADNQVLMKIPSADNQFSLIPEKNINSEADIQTAEVFGTKVHIIKSVSKETGLTFVAVIPQKEVLVQIRQKQRNMIILMISTVAVGGVCILLFVRYRGRKIADILQILFKIEDIEPVNRTNDEMMYISNSLKKLISNNTSLKNSVQEKELMTREMLLKSLLFIAEDKIEEELKKYDIYLEDKKILMLTFIMTSENQGETGIAAENLSIYKQILQTTIGEIVPGKQYMCDMDIKSGVILCALDKEFNQNPEEAFGEQLKKLSNIFLEGYDVRLRIGVSNICMAISQISKVYDQLSEVIQYGLCSKENVLFYNEYIETREYYYFPMPLEERLINAVRTGNLEIMHNQLREVYQINVLERNIKPNMMHFLVNDLQCTLFRTLHGLSENIEIDEEEIYRCLEQLSNEKNILLRFKTINDLFRQICEKVHEKNCGTSDEQKEAIREYIMKNYSCSDLGLRKIADDFEYSSAYFSKLFKDLFQENFAVYLEKIRIEQVCMLLDGEDTMEKIAVKTGYNSVYVMRNAFKRVKGLTPNEYRKFHTTKKEKK